MTNAYTGKPELTIAVPISNDGFYPDLAIEDLMAAYRIPSEYVAEVIIDRLMLAMIEVNQQLKPVKTFLLLTYPDLAHYCTANSEQIGGMEITVKKYQEAVFSYAKALLLQQFRTMNRKAEAENLSKDSMENEHYWLKQSANAVLWFFDKFLQTKKPRLNYEPYFDYYPHEYNDSEYELKQLSTANLRASVI